MNSDDETDKLKVIQQYPESLKLLDQYNNLKSVWTDEIRQSLCTGNTFYVRLTETVKKLKKSVFEQIPNTASIDNLTLLIEGCLINNNHQLNSKYLQLIIQFIFRPNNTNNNLQYIENIKLLINKNPNIINRLME